MAQRFAQISDPHLSSLEDVKPGQLLSKRLLGYLSWRRRRRFEHRREVLDALRSDLREHQLDQLLISGVPTSPGMAGTAGRSPRHRSRPGQPRRLRCRSLGGYVYTLAGVPGLRR